MCVCTTPHLLYSAFLVLLVSAVMVKASSYLRAYGAKELWPYLRIRCELHCPYGYDTDVEGNLICACHDPCQKIRCFGGARCVVELPKLCTRDYCRPRATCTEANPLLPIPTVHHGLSLMDGDSMTSPTASLPARCRHFKRKAAQGCRKLRLRWFYDEVTGSCRTTLGCRAAGNTFQRRRGCERTCGVQTGRNKRQPYHVLRQPVCSQGVVPVLSGCQKPLKRWFFDSRAGSCRKFRSCPAEGNNFSRKRHCKRQCQQHGRVKRKGRRNQTWAANQ